MKDDYYIRYYLKSIDNPLFKDITAWHLWQFCLLQAFPNGWFTIGRNKIQSYTGIKGTTAYKALERLKKAKMITVSVTYGKLGFSKISIVNWEKYQVLGDSSSDHKVTKECPKSDQKVTHYDKEERRKNKETINKREKIEKNISVLFPEADIILNHYKETYGIKTEILKRLDQLKAARWLFQEKGLDRSLKAISAAFSCQGQEYAPSINNLMELKDKFGKLENFYKRLIVKEKDGQRGYKI